MTVSEVTSSHLRRFAGAFSEAFNADGFIEAFGAAFAPVRLGKAFVYGWEEAIRTIPENVNRLIAKPIRGRFLRILATQRSLMQELDEASPQLQLALEASVALLSLIVGSYSFLTPQVDYLTALFGFGIGVPLAGAVAAKAILKSATLRSSIGYWQLEVTALAFVAGGVGSIAHVEFGSGFIELASGLPAALGIPVLGSSATRRQLLSYCYGAFLGPLVCYQFAIRWCLPALGWSDLSLEGYFIALIIGAALAIEMPITYWIDKSSMMPLTFAAGIITGFAIMSALFALGLLSLFGWPGCIVAASIVVIIFYALRPL